MALDLEIEKRPFSVEPFTELMMPDGIFDAGIHSQYIACHIINKEKAPITNVEIYLESVGDIGIKVTPETHLFVSVPAGSSVFVRWLADFSMATPGKKLISIRAAANGDPSNRLMSKIFVSKTEYDQPSRTFKCQVPQGLFEMTVRTVHGPKYKNENDLILGPWLFVEFTCVVTPAGGGYKGVRGELPFQDPWWKILAIIVAIVAGLASIIAAALGAGKASGGVKCDLEKMPNSKELCQPDISFPDKSVAGVLSFISALAVKAAFADDEDVWYRGQEATPPADDEVTKSEIVSTKIGYMDDHPPVAGAPFPVNVDWQYVRVTDKKRYEYSVTETVMNTTVIGNVEVETPKRVKIGTDRFIIRARCPRPSGVPYRGSEAYILCLVQAPNRMTFKFLLKDDGILHDMTANDGWFTGDLALNQAAESVQGKGGNPVGLWKVFVIIQDVNLAPLSISPFDAAKHIGGTLLSSPFSISMKPGICPYAAFGGR